MAPKLFLMQIFLPVNYFIFFLLAYLKSCDFYLPIPRESQILLTAIDIAPPCDRILHALEFVVRVGRTLHLG